MAAKAHCLGGSLSTTQPLELARLEPLDGIGFRADIIHFLQSTVPMYTCSGSLRPLLDTVHIMQQMKLILTIMTILPFAATSADDVSKSLLTQFDDLPGDLQWNVVNDNVMGGRSRGGYTIQDGILRFTGATNTRGGGFSSLRTSRAQLPFTSDTDGIAMRMKGDFRTYIFRVETRGGYTYWADVPTRSDWQDVAIPFENFTLRWRGYQRRGPALKPENIDSLGLMLYDKRDGPFRLEVDWISTWQR